MGKFAVWLLFITTLLAAGDAVVIVGPQAGVDSATGQRPFRQDFSVFKESGPAFDLYIQALYYFMKQNQSDVLSYYQIAGIHGVPFQSWDGVDGTNTQSGYCTHGSILFPSWHRPYLALFEVGLWLAWIDIPSLIVIANSMGLRESHCCCIPNAARSALSRGCEDISNPLLGLG